MTLLGLCYIVSRQGAVTCASNLAPACLAPAGGRKRRRQQQHGRLGQRHASLSSIEGATHDSGSTGGPPEADAAFDGSKDKKSYWTTCSNGDLGEEFVVLKLCVDLRPAACSATAVEASSILNHAFACFLAFTLTPINNITEIALP